MSQFSLNVIKFEDVRKQIVDYLKENSEYSSVFDFTAANISMIVDTMTYVTMLMSYQLTNVTNNLFLDTTNLRKNAVSIAKTMGYRPKRVIASKISGTVEYYSPSATATFTASDSILIPAQTTFIAENGNQYLNFVPITLTVSDSDPRLLTADIELYEGIFKTFTYLGTGLPFQSFVIPSKNVEENIFNLYVKNNTDNINYKWDEVKQSFNLISTTSYFVEEDTNTEGHVKVIFGDSSFGLYPDSNQVVTVEYLETNADNSNDVALVSFDTSVVSASFVGFDVANFNPISDTTIRSYGGAPYETLDSIKESAPKSFAMAGRAVTRNDYNTLLSRNSYIHRSNVIGGDELFKGDSTKLGNIYLTAIPLYVNSTNLLESNEIYLTSIQEVDLLSELNRYRIISTNIEFVKPSYIYITATPTLEIANDLNAFEEQKLITDTKTELTNFVSTNYDVFNPVLRTSKLNSVIGNKPNVLSSYIDYVYYFLINPDSFYPNSTDNAIYLPFKIEEKDAYGNIVSVSNFVRTNLEQKELLGIPASGFLPYTDRTIYGTLENPNVDRHIYNEDVVLGDEAETCELFIEGENVFFSVYRFNSDLTKSVILNNKLFSVNNEVDVPIGVTLGVSADMDNYTLTIDSDPPFATIKRTLNRDYGFKGLVKNESDITSTTHGDFYEIVNSFSVTAVSGMAFDSVEVGDFIIYNSNLSGGVWVKTNYLGAISATDDEVLFKTTDHNTIYQISASGDFDGYVEETVSAGEYIIFNVNSSNPYKWEKMNYHILSGGLSGLDASIDLPIQAVDYELKYVTNIIAPTNFGGRTSTSFSDGDIIFFNPAASADVDKWELIINSSSVTSLTPIQADVISGGSLESFDYHPVTGDVLIGDAYVVNGLGNFGTSYYRVNWNDEDEIAFDGDVLVYVGNERWNLFQLGQPQIFNIDASNYNSLPIALYYGDILNVVSSSGDFNGGTPDVYQIGDNIVYVGNNEWLPLVSEGLLSAASSANLPEEASVGDVMLINDDGNFLNSYIIAPSGDTFVQGDYIIFNGTNWTKMKEYTIEYLQMSETLSGRDYINNLGFNSVFHYEYDVDTSYYNMHFHDIFNGTKIGTFRYTTTVPEEIPEVGKITFEVSVNGNYNYQDQTDAVNITSIFESNDINKIRILPRNKTDLSGNVTGESITDFDTHFNNYVSINVDTVNITRY